MTTSLAGAPRHTRDRFLDLIRTLAVVGVVVQHWTMPVLGYSDDTLATGNALATPGWWIVTWLSQVMPLVFFAGGAANLISLHRARATGADTTTATRAWLAGRLRRLLLPVLPLLAVWLVVPTVLRDLGVPEQPVAIGGAIAAQLLWFLAVYLLAIVATPLMAAAHRRFGFAVVPALALVAVAVDVARFGGVPLVGYANAVFVWLAAAQLGFHYVDGALGRLSTCRSFALSAAGFGATALLVAFGPYAQSMIGMPGAPVSNMSPPNVALVGLAVGQVGLVLAARPLLTRLAARRPVAAALSWAGPRFMSIYLWHMPALIVVAGVAVVALGYTTPQPGTLGWLAMVPVWLAATTAVLAVLVRVAGRFETEPSRTGRARSGRTGSEAARPAATPALTALVAASLLGATGLLGLAARGFGNGPELWAAFVVVAYVLARPVVSVGQAATTSEPDTNPEQLDSQGAADQTSRSLAGVS